MSLVGRLFVFSFFARAVASSSSKKTAHKTRTFKGADPVLKTRTFNVLSDPVLEPRINFVFNFVFKLRDTQRLGFVSSKMSIYARAVGLSALFIGLLARRSCRS